MLVFVSDCTRRQWTCDADTDIVIIVVVVDITIVNHVVVWQLEWTFSRDDIDRLVAPICVTVCELDVSGHVINTCWTCDGNY